MAQEKGSRQYEGRSGRLLKPISAEAASSPQLFFFQEFKATPTSKRSCTNLPCNSMKKSGWPTSSARPRAFREEVPGPQPMRLVKALPPVRKLLLDRSTAAGGSNADGCGCGCPPPLYMKLPFGDEFVVVRSASASASCCIHVAKFPKACEIILKVFIASRSLWVLRARNAYTRL